MNKKGFTLLELVVAIAIMLIIGGVVAPMLLAHLKDAKVASLNEAILNVKTAFNSWYTAEAGNISDGGDGDYMNDMVQAGWLSATPTTAGLDWKIASASGSSGVEYYINATNATADDFNVTMARLDEKIDDGNVGTGILKSDNDSFVYLLYDTNSSTGFEQTP